MGRKKINDRAVRKLNLKTPNELYLLQAKLAVITLTQPEKKYKICILNSLWHWAY